MQIEMITDVQIDLYGEKQYYKASAKQGDKNTRYLRVQLMNNGNEFQIPDDVILIANIKKPDGKFCYNECMKRENRVMVQLTNQALAAAGTAYCDIEMRDENGELILSSAVFTIEIEQGMRNEGAMESSNEMTFIDKKFAEMKAMHDKVAEMKAEVEEAKNQVEDTYEAYVEALENHAKDTENPHKVSREQLKVEKTDNTSDMDKPVSIAQQAALDALYEQLAAYTRQQIANLINGAPSSLDTLKEVADAIAAHKTIMDALDAAIGKKASAAEFDSHTKDTTKHVTPTERTNWNDANTKKHTHGNKSVLDGITSTLISEWSAKMEKTGDSANNTVTFSSGDATNPTGWADIGVVASGEKHSSLMRKFSLAVKNLRYLWKLLGGTSLAGIGDGTVTGAINALNTGFAGINSKFTSAIGSNRLEFNAIKYTGKTTMTALFKELNIACVCLTSTENISDKPTNKYGTIIVFKFSETRSSAICICIDGTMYANAWNQTNNAVTGWKEK